MRHRLTEFASGAALVIGGSGAIGAAICVALAEAGSNVALTFRTNAEAAAQVVRKVELAGFAGLALQVDMADRSSVLEAVKNAIARFGKLHSVIYAAGPPIDFLYISEISGDEWARVVNTDVYGCFNLIEAALPHLRSQGSGSFLAVTTAAVDHAPPRDILSAAPKAAIEMLVKGVAREEGRNGIRANCVRPGLISAGLGHSAVNTGTQSYVERMAKAVPLRRAGSAEEVADVAVFLLSDAARYVTGAAIPVAGGLQLV